MLQEASDMQYPDLLEADTWIQTLQDDEKKLLQYDLRVLLSTF